VSGLVTSWNRISAGDVISFQYKSKGSSKKRLHTVLVLNPKFYITVEGERVIQMIGLKLAEQRIRTIKEASKVVKQLLSGVGEIKVVDKDKDIYRVEMKKSDIFWMGAKYNVYKRLRPLLKKEPVYRTYNWEEAKKSSVQLAPLPLPPHLKKLIDKEVNIIEETIEE
jgi:hypothetical protein